MSSRWLGWTFKRATALSYVCLCMGWLCVAYVWFFHPGGSMAGELGAVIISFCLLLLFSIVGAALALVALFAVKRKLAPAIALVANSLPILWLLFRI